MTDSMESWCGAGKLCWKNVFWAMMRFHGPALYQVSRLSLASCGSPYRSSTSCAASFDSEGQPRTNSAPVVITVLLVRAAPVLSSMIGGSPRGTIERKMVIHSGLIARMATPALRHVPSTVLTQPGPRRIASHGPCEEITLSLVALEFDQGARLGLVLDAFGDSGELQLLAEPDGGGDDLSRLIGRMQCQHERPVDLDFGKRQLRQLHQR